MKPTLAALTLALALSSPLQAQGLPPDSLFSRMIGTWVLQGTIARQPTTHDVTFDWLLGNEYVQMHEVSRERGPDGKPAYEAVVLFGRDPRTGEYAALWLDNTGTSAFDLIGTGRGYVAGDSIPFLFGYDAVNSFHNTFVYDREHDSWAWHMDNDSAGVRRPFARVALVRQQPPAQATVAEGEVFLAAEVDESPRLRVGHMRYHPKDRLDRSGKVTLQFVVDTAGHPVPGSTKVMISTDRTFEPAAIMTLLAREYSPGTSRGQKVRVLMQEAISFRGKDVRCDTLVDAQGVVLCADSLKAGN